TANGLHPSRPATVDYIAGTLSLQGGAGHDVVLVDDSGDDAANAGTLAGNVVTGLGMAGSIMLSSAEDLIVALGAGADTFHVPATQAGIAATLRTGAGKDTIHLGTASAAAPGRLGALQGAITVDGEGP